MPKDTPCGRDVNATNINPSSIDPQNANLPNFDSEIPSVVQQAVFDAMTQKEEDLKKKEEDLKKKPEVMEGRAHYDKPTPTKSGATTSHSFPPSLV